MVSKANLQGLAVANNKVYTHPITIAIWVALSSVFIHLMNWWPASVHGFMGYLKPIPAFASTAVPVMFFVDWINRPYFESLTQDVLRYTDMSDISGYYSRSPASGLWLLEFGNTFVGLIAMDAPPAKKVKDEQKAPQTALIRHFHVEESFRKSNIQDDLLDYAVKHAFNTDPKLERIEATDSPLILYLRRHFAVEFGLPLKPDPKSKFTSSAGQTILFCLLYPPSSLLPTSSQSSVEVHDWMERVPGYDDADSQSELLELVENALQDPSRPTNVIVDSMDTLLADKGSLSETYKCLSKVYALVKRHSNARFILHSQSPSTLLPLISQTSFCSSLAHIITHPTALLTHLTTEFLMPPPPLSPLPKFWGLFLPMSERVHDTERLIFGSSGEGSGNPAEFVVELIVREGAGRKRGVERVLEGWSSALDGPCELSALEGLKQFVKKPQQEQVSGPDPTQNLSFNLNLTSSQQESRSQVPLPYAHEGKPITINTPGAIFYDPDSADDIDDDDPDEDLDI
ncbi:unnamed protein product [Cyclocybe aegerita]|uniref:Elongator complex protein 5 n=1 Tax=Cyclocybe aegerita TaxID=1973307 RepID=A0A8S0VY13_CYCAE|nr:unnamed protein product [Cyclocybe aegerita]